MYVAYIRLIHVAHLNKTEFTDIGLAKDGFLSLELVGNLHRFAAKGGIRKKKIYANPPRTVPRVEPKE